MIETNYLKVAIPVPLNKLFTYSVVTEQNLVGCRVLVPFGAGKSQKKITGVVVEQSNATDVKTKIKPLLEILDIKPIFNEKMLIFLRWISTYYMSPIGETMKVAIPAGISPKTVLRIMPIREVAESAMQEIYINNPMRHRLLEFLLSNSSAFTLDYLEKTLKIDNINYHVNYLHERGLIRFDFQTQSKVKAKIQKAVLVDENLINDKIFIKATMDLLDKTSPKQAEIFSLLCINQAKNKSHILLTDLNARIFGAAAAVKALEKKELIQTIYVEVNRSLRNKDEDKLATKNEHLLILTQEQTYSINRISTGLESNAFNSFLLHGVTGSGKTIVYIHAIEKALSQGKSTLLLLPEISLTPQLIDRFDIVFPDMISVLHSRMSDAERFDSWRAVHNGQSKIVIGARSALFSPLKNLGLIIVDEEHEQSYKQDSPQPYYQARDAALVRAKFENATIVLGSASPSIESYYNCEQKKIELLEIKHRADNAVLPTIKLIDMAAARNTGQAINGFSRELIDKIKEKIEKREGIILMQNKRGFSNFVECADCGNVPQCKNCSVSLTYHQASKSLRCHYCGYTLKIFNICELCGSTKIGRIGRGTQRIEEELEAILNTENIKPKITRLDLDTAAAKGAHRKILQQFASAESDILIGTQMVAKGLDFDRVTLVGVINADIQLQLPDFRANERTFQLLSQVAGRAGRSGLRAGEVIIQTYQPSAYAINMILQNDYSKFYELELTKRQSSQFPPYVRFCVIEFSSLDEEKASRHALAFVDMLPRHESLIIYPPQAAPIAKLNNRFRWQLVVKNIKSIDSTGKYLRQALAIASAKYSEKLINNAVRMRIDIDSFSAY